MTQDTRKDRRVKIVSLNVRYKSATVDEFIENHAYDVSRGGIFIKTANPFPPGTLLKFEIRLASEQAVIAGVGRIVWKRDTGTSSTERPAGMGVKFIKLDEPSKIVIDRLVNTKPDAGRAYEAEDHARMVSERPVPRATPTARPDVSASVPVPSRVPGARSMSPAGGIAAAAKAPSIGAGGGPLRKATMIGVGASSAPAAPSSSPALAGLPSTVPPAARPSFPTAPSAPPRPGGGPTPMFPKGNRESDWPPKQEPTVMKQAAELLEEALREAGGSMEEIGTNPLFSSSGPSTSSTADLAKAPVPSAREWTARDEAPPEPQTGADSGKPPVDHDGPVSTSSAAPRSARLTPTSDRPTSAVASEPPPAKKKSGAGVVIFWLVAAAAVIGVVVMFRDQLIGGGAPPEPVSAPPATQTAQAPAPNPSPVASASAAPSAAKESPSSSASAQPSTSASIDKTPTAQKSAEGTNVVAPAAPAPPPRQFRPAAKPAAPAAGAAMAGDTNAQTTAPTEATPTTATASPAPAAPPVKVAPPPRTKPAKPADDNPY
jgi:uncharacterized protein (TIGR02266 family)